MAKKSLLATGVVSLMTLLVLSAWAAPLSFNYQGRMVDKTSGEPVDGTVNMTFRIYDGDGVGAILLWQETHTGVAVTNGIYNVHMGSGTTNVGIFDPDLFAGNNRWLRKNTFSPWKLCHDTPNPSFRT